METNMTILAKVESCFFDYLTILPSDLIKRHICMLLVEKRTIWLKKIVEKSI